MSVRHIGSRGSDLALWQSRTVLAALRESGAAGWDPDITVITTRGDVDEKLYLAGGVEKGFFKKELDVALLERRIEHRQPAVDADERAVIEAQVADHEPRAGR